MTDEETQTPANPPFAVLDPATPLTLDELIEVGRQQVQAAE